MTDNKKEESVPLAEGAVDISQHSVEHLENNVTTATQPTKMEIEMMRKQHKAYISSLKDMVSDLRVEVDFLDLKLKKHNLQMQLKDLLPELKDIPNAD